MFQPILETNISDILNINKSYKNLSKGKTPHIFITILNPYNKDIKNKGDILGTLHNVSATISVIYKKETNVNKISQGTELNTSVKWQPIVDLADLTEEQRKKVHDVLRTQCEVFSKDPSNIGNIPNFQLDINLTDSLPVHESYCSIPRQLYDEVKNHIDDLLTNRWIQKSHSAYTSPMVYVRKNTVAYAFA